MKLRGAGLVAGLAVVALMCWISLWIGSRDVSFAATLGALFADDGSVEAAIIRDQRVPRTVLAVLVGVALGLSGALMQAMTRNPLADPGLLGVQLGAAAAAVTGIAFGVRSGHVWLAMAGAAVSVVVVYLLGSAGRSAATPERLVLGGAAISAVLLAYISALSLVDPRTFDRYRFWNVGAFSGRGLDVVEVVWPFIVAGVLVSLLLIRPLNMLALGDETSAALGANVNRVRLLGALCVTLLTGAATAAAGPIVFIGLAVPHVARMIGGADNRWVLPYSMVLAPIVLLAADVVGRVISPPGEVEVGIVTACLGAPVFIALVRRRKLAQL